MRRILNFLKIPIILIFGLIFILFTQYGNNIIKPFIEDGINENLESKISIPVFQLRYNFINIELQQKNGNILNINGNFNIFNNYIDFEYKIISKDLSSLKDNFKGRLESTGIIEGKIDKLNLTSQGYLNYEKFKINIKQKNNGIHYAIQTNNLASLKNIINQDLNGELSINGIIKNEKIKGTGKIENANFDYNFIFTNSIIKNLNLNLLIKSSDLLHIIDMPNFASSDYLPVKIHFDKISELDTKGSIKIKIKNFRLKNNDTFYSIRRITKFDMTKEYFNGVINANIINNQITSKFDLKSRNTNIYS